VKQEVGACVYSLLNGRFFWVAEKHACTKEIRYEEPRVQPGSYQCLSAVSKDKTGLQMVRKNRLGIHQLQKKNFDTFQEKLESETSNGGVYRIWSWNSLVLVSWQGVAHEH
jgi:hypothetical protein